MAIELVTGLPGASKTLTTIERVIDIAAKGNRPVFYSGIKELIEDDPRLKGTQWTKFDPTKWHEVVPDGAIIFIDEVQTIFRARAITSNPPPYVTELEQHRHKGIDFYVTTQHPRLIDPALKVLTANHRHLIRIWGGESSTVHYWDGIENEPEKAGAKGRSQKTVKAFPKDLYGLYKSAELHTSKRKIPKRVFMLAALPILLAVCGFVTYKMLHKVTPGLDKGSSAATSAKSSSPGGGDLLNPGQTASANGKTIDPVQDAKQYLFNQTPRIAGLAYTAPKFDQLTTPTHVPIPAMCMSKQSHDGKTVTCKCYSQQATPLDVSYNMCIEFSRNGFFREFDADRDQQQVARSEASEKALQRVPDAPLPEHGQIVSGGVMVLPGQPMGPARTEKSAPLNGTSEIQDGPPNNRATRAAATTVAGL